jgi:hypothetical protein
MMTTTTDFDLTDQPDPAPMRPAAMWLRYDSRADGWTRGRRAAFLQHLADNGVVSEAAAAVGKSLASAYALRRRSGGYAFSIGWEAALLIARRHVADRLMEVAIRGETAVWTREEGKTTYTRFNARTGLALLDRVSPATSLSEVRTATNQFDWFCHIMDTDGDFWPLFDTGLAHNDFEARERVRLCLQLSDESADYDGGVDVYQAASEEEVEEEEEERPIEYKSMPEGDGAHFPSRRPVLDTGLGYSPPLESARSLAPCQARGDCRGDGADEDNADSELASEPRTSAPKTTNIPPLAAQKLAETSCEMPGRRLTKRHGNLQECVHLVGRRDLWDVAGHTYGRNTRG